MYCACLNTYVKYKKKSIFDERVNLILLKEMRKYAMKYKVKFRIFFHLNLWKKNSVCTNMMNKISHKIVHKRFFKWQAHSAQCVLKKSKISENVSNRIRRIRNMLQTQVKRTSWQSVYEQIENPANIKSYCVFVLYILLLWYGFHQKCVPQ